MSSSYRIGFVQTDPVFGDIERNRAEVESAAAQLETDLLVLPELFTTGYQFASRKEAESLAEAVGGPTTEFLIGLSQSRNCFIVAGLAEADGDRVYNAAVITGPQGLVARYRKLHLFDTEKEVFDPGDRPLSVFDLDGAKVGVMICFDWRFPETARTLSLAGADIIAHPSNLVLPHCPQSMITRCLENRVFAATCDRVGVEQRIPGETLRFIGQSQVVDPDGNVMIRASEDQPEHGVVTVDLERARQKHINPRNDLLSDRRSDKYRIT